MTGLTKFYFKHEIPIHINRHWNLHYSCITLLNSFCYMKVLLKTISYTSRMIEKNKHVFKCIYSDILHTYLIFICHRAVNLLNYNLNGRTGQLINLIFNLTRAKQYNNNSCTSSDNQMNQNCRFCNLIRRNQRSC